MNLRRRGLRLLCGHRSFWCGLSVTVFGVLCFEAGRLGDIPLRRPIALAALAGMLACWFLLLAQAPTDDSTKETERG